MMRQRTVDALRSSEGAPSDRMAFDPARLVPGDVVPGTTWVIVRKLGEGGMGVVYEVRKDLGIRGAIKLIRPTFASRPQAVELALHEIRILTMLQHRNIVRVLDAGQLPDGTPFVVMDLLSGGTASQVLRAYESSVPPMQVFDIASGVAEALDHAHLRNLVHRDIKPGNVFLHLQPDGREPIVVVLDFGIAVLVEGQPDSEWIGTPPYMAPEQFRGEPVSSRTDWYALGVLVYELLTGRLPWSDMTGLARIRHAHLYEAPIPARTFCKWLPESVDRGLMQALSKDPAHRPDNRHEFMQRLSALQICAWTANPANVNRTQPSLRTLTQAAERMAEKAASATREGGEADPRISRRTTKPIGAAEVDAPAAGSQREPTSQRLGRPDRTEDIAPSPPRPEPDGGLARSPNRMHESEGGLRPTQAVSRISERSVEGPEDRERGRRHEVADSPSHGSEGAARSTHEGVARGASREPVSRSLSLRSTPDSIKVTLPEITIPRRVILATSVVALVAIAFAGGGLMALRFRAGSASAGTGSGVEAQARAPSMLVSGAPLESPRSPPSSSGAPLEWPPASLPSFSAPVVSSVASEPSVPSTVASRAGAAVRPPVTVPTSAPRSEPRRPVAAVPSRPVDDGYEDLNPAGVSHPSASGQPRSQRRASMIVDHL